MELSMQFKRQIANYQPITVRELTLYPIKVKYYTEYSIGRAAIEFMQQTLPVDCTSLPLLAAFYKLDYKAHVEKKEPTGLFSAALLFLALALGEGDNAISRLADIFTIKIDANDPSVLKSVVYNGDNAGAAAEITPVTFGVIRPILAAQNGLELHSTRADADLVQAERDLSEVKGVKLNADINDMKIGVCSLSGDKEEEVDEWAILKLLNRAKAYQRIFDYVICGIGECQGASWKGGNPAPSLWFGRAKSGTPALVPISDFANGEGEKAIKNTLKQ